MDIRIAKNAGFCFGVRRAIGMVEEALCGERPVYSLGPVIHNPQVISQLRARGLRLVDRLDEVREGVIVIQSHGTPLHTYRSLEERGLSFVDTTCPFVKKMHHQARSLMKDGYQLIIAGDANHSEITSLTDDPHFSGIVISRSTDLDGVKLSSRVGMISQTTQTIENFCAVSNRLLPHVNELKIFNTICDATITRQTEARRIAAGVEAMVVIGGRNSANTQRLVEICQESGCRTFWVETADELEPKMFEELETIGLTSGASTPEWTIKEVISRLESIKVKSSVTGHTLPAGGNSI